MSNIILFFVLLTTSATYFAEAKTANIIDIYRPMIFEPAVLKSRKPVVVFYYSSSECKPCMWSILPMLERMAKNKSESIYLAKVDLDKVPNFRVDHAIEKLPTTMVFYKGDVLDSTEGLSWNPIVKVVNNAVNMYNNQQKHKKKQY